MAPRTTPPNAPTPKPDFLGTLLEFLKTAPVIVQLVGVTIIAAGIVLWMVGPDKIKGFFESKPQVTAPKPYAVGTASTGTYVSQSDKEIPPGTSGEKQTSGSPLANNLQKAGSWHMRNTGADPPKSDFIEKPTGEWPHDSFVKYEFYTNDRCVHVIRRVNGKAIDDWVPDVNAPAHIHEDVSVDATEAKPDEVRRAAIDSFGIDTLRDLLPAGKAVHAAMQDGPQFCMNPHPGNYQWYWGPVNGCLQPQFRVFNDGCRHYQIFNVCAGVWLPDINWTYCRPPMHF